MNNFAVAVALIAATAALCPAQIRVTGTRIVKAPGEASGRVVATLDAGEERFIARVGIKAWPALSGLGVLFTSPSEAGELLTLYDARTWVRQPVADGPLHIEEVTEARTSDGQYVYALLGIDLKTKMPSTLIARAGDGVYRVLELAVPETVQGDVLVVRRYTEDAIRSAQGVLARAVPAGSDRVPLVAAAVTEFIGIWAGNAAAADAPSRKVALLLESDGSAVLRHEYPGKGVVEQEGRWRVRDKQELSLVFNAGKDGRAPNPLTFTVSESSLAPKDWDRQVWGSAGPPRLSRVSEADQPGPK
jgi:hypothetical protein